MVPSDSNPPKDSGSGFRLEADERLTNLQRTRRLTAETYRKKIGEYCHQFGKVQEDGTVRPLDRKTVERWIRRGREIEGGPDLPPLDAPAEMATWWRRVMERKVPMVFLDLEEVGEGDAAPPAKEEKAAEGGDQVAEMATEQEAAAKEALQRAMVQAEAEGLGFEAALERARLAERLAYFQWQTVLVEPEKWPASAIDKRKKAWEDASGVLLRAEEKAEKIMDQSSEWARWEEVEVAVGEKLGVVARGVRSLLTRVTTKATLPPGLFETLEPVFQSEVDNLFSVMGDGGFTALLELSSE